MWRRGYLPRVRTGDLELRPAGTIVVGLEPGSDVRVLSRDAMDGACTCLWTLPPGWRHSRAFAFDAPVAWFVLTGTLSVGYQRLGAGGYRRHPAGLPFESLSTDEGATVLAMWDRAPHLRDATDLPRQPDAEAIVVDTGNTAGRPTFIEGPVPGITVKLLHRDTDTGGMTLLVSIPPGWAEPRFEHHDCVEESFKLDGDLSIVEDGREQALQGGDYFFRPPHIAHGRMHTRDGTTSLIRFSATPVNHYDPPDPERRRSAAEALS